MSAARSESGAAWDLRCAPVQGRLRDLVDAKIAERAQAMVAETLRRPSGVVWRRRFSRGVIRATKNALLAEGRRALDAVQRRALMTALR